MKLKNKKTGEIVEWFNNTDGIFPNSLAELNEEWEDYEKQCWYITSTGEVIEGELDADWRDERRIGNYFETKEEANQAVEKLKAWKRLVDKGFRFEGWYGCNRIIHFRITSLDEDGDCLPHFVDDDTANDLDLLFGGEE